MDLPTFPQAQNSTSTIDNSSVRRFLETLGIELTEIGMRAYGVHLREAMTRAETCARCQGLDACPLGEERGQQIRVEPAGNVIYFVSYPCAALQESLKRQRVERLLKSSRIPERYRRMAFETYQVTPKNKHALQRAREAVAGRRGLMLCGNPGSGKTHLALAIANERIRQGRQAVFVTVPELMQDMRSAMRSNDEAELMDLIRDCELLVLDDLGAENATDWVLERLFMVVNARYMNEQQTVVTSNYTPRELITRMAAVKDGPRDMVRGQRIVSRLSEMCEMVEIREADHRLEVV